MFSIDDCLKLAEDGWRFFLNDGNVIAMEKEAKEDEEYTD